MQPINIRKDRSAESFKGFGLAGEYFGPRCSEKDIEELGYTAAPRGRIFRTNGTTGAQHLVDVEYLQKEERPRTPERALLAAVLGRALMDITGNNSIMKRAAHQWIFGPDRDETKPHGQDIDFSFRAVCQWLSISPKAVRLIVSERLLQPVIEPFEPKVRKHLPLEQMLSLES